MHTTCMPTCPVSRTSGFLLEARSTRRWQRSTFCLIRHMPDAFGGSNYSNTPDAAQANTHECGCASDPVGYFSYWALGKNAAICAWNQWIATIATAICKL